jgi:hypothetical protein
MMYVEQFCDHCRNMVDRNDGRGAGCPIMDLHMLWNYDAIGKDADKVKHEALEFLIPSDKEGFPKECSMFLPEEGSEHLGAAQRNLDAHRLAEWRKLYGGGLGK